MTHTHQCPTCHAQQPCVAPHKCAEADTRDVPVLCETCARKRLRKAFTAVLLCFPWSLLLAPPAYLVWNALTAPVVVEWVRPTVPRTRCMPAGYRVLCIDEAGVHEHEVMR